MDRADLPLLEVSRPALALVDAFGYDEPSVSTQTLQETAQRPRTTVTRYLNQLTGARLILRVRKGEYAIPSRSTFSRLLLEPSRYRRSVLLYADVLDQRGETPWAFACLPIRHAYPMDIDRAIPVLHPDERLKSPSRSRPYAEALWYAFDPERIERDHLQTDDEETQIKVPLLPPELSLALLISSLDPRYMQAAQDAAQKLDLSVEETASSAKHLAPASPPLTALRPNTVVFPEWLEAFWETAKTQHARHALDNLLADDDSSSPAGSVMADA